MLVSMIFRYARSSGVVQNSHKHCSVGKNQDDCMTFVRVQTINWYLF